MDIDEIIDVIGFGTPEEVMELFRKALIQLDDIIYLGMTPLGVSVFFDNNKVAMYLIEMGADLSFCDRNQGGEPPLKIAFDRGNKSIFDKLIDEGASINDPGWMNVSVSDRMKGK